MKKEKFVKVLKIAKLWMYPLIAVFGMVSYFKTGNRDDMILVWVAIVGMEVIIQGQKETDIHIFLHEEDKEKDHRIAELGVEIQEVEEQAGQRKKTYFSMRDRMRSEIEKLKEERDQALKHKHQYKCDAEELKAKIIEFQKQIEDMTLKAKGMVEKPEWDFFKVVNRQNQIRCKLCGEIGIHNCPGRDINKGTAEMVKHLENGFGFKPDQEAIEKVINEKLCADILQTISENTPAIACAAEREPIKFENMVSHMKENVKLMDRGHIVHPYLPLDPPETPAPLSEDNWEGQQKQSNVDEASIKELANTAQVLSKDTAEIIDDLEKESIPIIGVDLSDLQDMSSTDFNHTAVETTEEATPGKEPSKKKNQKWYAEHFTTYIDMIKSGSPRDAVLVKMMEDLHVSKATGMALYYKWVKPSAPIPEMVNQVPPAPQPKANKEAPAEREPEVKSAPPKPKATPRISSLPAPILKKLDAMPEYPTVIQFKDAVCMMHEMSQYSVAQLKLAYKETHKNLTW